MDEARGPAPEVAFVGSIPDVYDHYLGPLLFFGYADDLTSRVALRPGATAVLEVAAGTGIVSERLRARLPASVGLTVTDLNAPMLDLARRRLAGAANVETREADATALPFPDAAFDAVVCQFGVMFFPDKARAARETWRVLRPQGQWLFNVWGSWEEDPFARLTDEAIARFFPDDPPSFYRIPYSMSDPDLLRGLVLDAGFAEPEIVTVDLVSEVPSAEYAATGLVRGNPITLGRGDVADPGEMVDAVAEALAGEFGDHPLRLPLRARVVSARRKD